MIRRRRALNFFNFSIDRRLSFQPNVLFLLLFCHLHPIGQLLYLCAAILDDVMAEKVDRCLDICERTYFSLEIVVS